MFVSATPGEYERTHSARIVEQIVRPTGIVDPEVEVRETRNQIDDLMNEIRLRADRDERVLVTTLTKKMSEDLTDYLLEMGFRVRYLHSEVDTLERIQIIRQLRLGEYDVLVGVNLLREGLDLPEVSLVAILDADKEGFLRGETSLIQTIGRAARNVEGKVLMYADKETAAMRAALVGDRPPARDPAGIQRGARDHARDDRQGDLRHRRVPAVGLEGAALAAAAQGARGDDGRRPRSSARSSSSRRRCWPRPRTCDSSMRLSCATRSGTSSGSSTWRSPPVTPRSRLANRRSGRFAADRISERLTLGDGSVPSFRYAAPVALERQSIEKQDFPTARQGYDKDAVDAHLAAIADEFEHLTLASSASERSGRSSRPRRRAPREIQREADDAAQATRQEAEQAARHAREGAGRLSELAAALSQRLDESRRELEALVGRCRAPRAAPEPSRSCGPRRASTRIRRTPSPRRPPSSRRPRPPRRLLRRRPRSMRRLCSNRRPRSTRLPSRLAAAVPAGTADENEAARLIALNMALDGSSRDETAKYLDENFQLADRDRLLDEVYASVDG